MHTSVYYTQPNGLCELLNKTIKDSLVKVLDGNPGDWPNIIEGVLFARSVSRRTSTKCSHSFLCLIQSLLYQSMSSII